MTNMFGPIFKMKEPILEILYWKVAWVYIEYSHKKQFV